MKERIGFLRLFAICLVLMLSVACGSESDSDDDDNNIEAITDRYAADDAVKNVADLVYGDLLDSLSTGSFTDEEVYGTTGTAIATGHINYENNVSCGSDCIRSSSDVSITVVFNNYKGPVADNEDVTLTGTVTYSDTTWSRQSGLSYTSGGSISVSGTNVQYYSLATTDYSQWGYQDTITFSGSGDGIHAPFSGWCTASNGETYSF